MTIVKYEVVEHDGGWAYKVEDVFSETFPTHADALEAAKAAARHHEQPGGSESIEYQDASGRWHEEDVSGRDRPETEVLDALGESYAPGRVLGPSRVAMPSPRAAAIAPALVLAGAVGFLVGYLFRRTSRR
jgi:hypothetical protein